MGHVRVKQERNVCVAKMRGQGECTGRVKKGPGDGGVVGEGEEEPERGEGAFVAGGKGMR